MTTMSRNSSYKWHLIVMPAAKRKFDQLSRSTKQGVFRQLRLLLTADDPYAQPFVEMLKAKSFDRIRKFRVGDFRVMFVVETKETAHLKHIHKGTLFLLDIRDRKESYDV